jgi:Uma2 family endonuclease
MSIQLKRWTRAEYESMIALGVLTPESHVQLLDGEILQMTPQGAPHQTGVGLVSEILRSVVQSGYHVRVQAPLAIAFDGEPEPDVAVISGVIRDYATQHPATAALVVEVADTSLDLDRGRKQAAYARAGIPEYWILNIPDRALEVYRDPDPRTSRYRAHTILRGDDHVVSAVCSNRPISVARMLP